MGQQASGPSRPEAEAFSAEVFSTPATSPPSSARGEAPAAQKAFTFKPPSRAAAAPANDSALQFSSYHPLSGLPTPGYKGNLSASQQHALEEVRARIVALGLAAQMAAAVLAPAEDEDGLLLRFLRARGFDVAKATEMLRADLEWRAEQRVAELAACTEAEVLGCDPAIIAHYLPYWADSVDLQGRAAVWAKWGDLRVDEVLKVTTHEGMLRHHIWQQEAQMRRLRDHAIRAGVWVAQCVNVVDARHWHPGLASRAAMSFLREIAAIDQAHYPERMGAIVVINAPYTLSACWAIISSWLDAASRAKVHIISSERYWKPLLASLFPPDQIPAEYGGTARVVLRDLAGREKYVLPAAVPS